MTEAPTSRVHRYLITATADLKMETWAATGMFANWLDGRAVADDRETWLVTVFGRQAQTFLEVADRIGVTVEEIQGGGELETYELLVGKPGTGWQSSSASTGGDDAP